MSSFVLYMDPKDLDKFSDRQDYLDSLCDVDDSIFLSDGVVNGVLVTIPDEEETMNVFDEQSDRVLDLMDRLPKREADMLYMYSYKRKYQIDIGRIFNVSQGDVSYRIKRAIKRIKFLLEYPELDPFRMLIDLGKVLPYEDVCLISKKDTNPELDFCGSNVYLRIMIGMYQTSSQSVVANILGIYQNRVRYRFLKGITALRIAGEQEPNIYDKYVRAFDMIEKNPNILRELKIQKRWKHKFNDVLV